MSNVFMTYCYTIDSVSAYLKVERKMQLGTITSSPDWNSQTIFLFISGEIETEREWKIPILLIVMSKEWSNRMPDTNRKKVTKIGAQVTEAKAVAEENAHWLCKGGSIIERLTYSLSCLDSSKQVNLMTYLQPVYEIYFTGSIDFYK